MIKVTRLDGKTYWINPHLIESMEQTPDLTLVMLSGRKIILRDAPEKVISSIIDYRKKIGINTQEE
ncbi:flagellar FlbD family protein [Treponema parvum]|uniref:Flagellar FlbD family protein n=1 Tax=Treponema parvum TaxID=138851 RepID=A0A975EZL3_9SPIR|nr:flagellar FlbD family protein [Treponema parvum]QTQ11736.1 flagellar FlbD family protein [Treponema parvum]QTQ14109.1 flagellar FlbD family protein [Treponema parvum]QTQ16319.1 flagellar FlbD family protein [Treponema parvum]